MYLVFLLVDNIWKENLNLIENKIKNNIKIDNLININEIKEEDNEDCSSDRFKENYEIKKELIDNIAINQEDILSKKINLKSKKNRKIKSEKISNSKILLKTLDFNKKKTIKKDSFINSSENSRYDSFIYKSKLDNVIKKKKNKN